MTHVQACASTKSTKSHVIDCHTLGLFPHIIAIYCHARLTPLQYCTTTRAFWFVLFGGNGTNNEYSKVFHPKGCLIALRQTSRRFSFASTSSAIFSKRRICAKVRFLPVTLTIVNLILLWLLYPSASYIYTVYSRMMLMSMHNTEQCHEFNSKY